MNKKIVREKKEETMNQIDPISKNRLKELKNIQNYFRHKKELQKGR